MQNELNPTHHMLHACVGVMCERHERCVRYAYIDGTREPSDFWLGTCAPPGAMRSPGYIDVAFIGPPKPYHFRLSREDIGRTHSGE